MKTIFSALAVAAFLFALNARADPPTTISPQEEAEIVHALERGKEIYLHDQAAWHVTDAMREANPGTKAKPVIGWVTKRVNEKRIAAYFVRRDGDKLRVFYSGETEGSTFVGGHNYADDPNAPELEADLMPSMLAAAAAVSVLNNQVCGRRPNLVTLASEVAPGGWDVYAIVPEYENNEAALAGHKRVTIGADKKIFDVHDYSNSCLIGDIGKNSAALMITLPAERGLTPNEIHVFESLTHKLPIFVASSDGRAWAVEGERIRLLDQSEKETKSSTTPPSQSN